MNQGQVHLLIQMLINQMSLLVLLLQVLAIQL